MNESTLMQLKIIVERAVRPVRASTSRKRKMREELLAHVSDVFDEESANLGDDQIALERTAQRFGNAAEVTIQLQAAVPASDSMRRFCDARPGEPALRGALRVAWLTGALALVVFAGALFAGGWVSAWPREAVRVCVCAMLALPVYLFGLTLLTDWMEKALHDPAGRSRFKVALICVGSWLFMMLWVVGVITWRGWPADWDYLTAILVAVWLAPPGALFPYALAQSATVRRRYHEEWAQLRIDGDNGAAI
jgi:hypothetical protein